MILKSSNTKLITLIYFLILFVCKSDEIKKYNKIFTNDVQLISNLDDESIHQDSILKEETIGDPTWLDGFIQTRTGIYYSKNNVGVINYFAKEVDVNTKKITIEIIFRNILILCI